MFCKKYKKQVLVEDCEDCLTWRKCDPVCLKRGFVWGVPDREEPIWEYSYDEAEKSNEDVSMYFDEAWEGNSHLPKTETVQIKRIYKKNPIPPDIRWQVWIRDNFTCQECGTRMFLSIDHIYPKSKGGKTQFSNLQTLCKSCNSRKGNRIDR